MPHGAPLSDYDEPPDVPRRARRRPRPRRARDSDDDDDRDPDPDVLDLLAETVEATRESTTGGFGRPVIPSAAAAGAGAATSAVKRARTVVVDASAARGAAAGVVMFDDEATRYLRAEGRVWPDRTQAEANFRRTEFRLRVRAHPVPQFLDKVHAFTSGATRSYTLGGAGATVEQTGREGIEPGESDVQGAKATSLAPADRGRRADPDDDGGGPDPGHDITGILRIDARVYGAMQMAALQVTTRVPGVTSQALVCDNERVQTAFAQLTACVFLLNRSMSGAITVQRDLVRATVHTRDHMLRWLALHARFDARSGGRVRYYPQGVRGGRPSSEGDYARTPFMRWSAGTGYPDVDSNAGLPPPGEEPDDPLQSVRAYLPHNASRDW